MVITVGDKKFRFLRVNNKRGSKVDTLCLVKFKQYPRLGWAFAGHARLNHIDKFNKAEGKRVALIHAMNNLGVNQEYKDLAMDVLIENLSKPPLYFHTEILP